MGKGLREVTYSIWGKETAELLGCRTPRAQMWFKNCTDTHQVSLNTL